MIERRILLLDASGLRAIHWQQGNVYEEAAFDADEAGISAFADYMSRHLHDLFYLLADVAEEGFQVDKIPFVRGKDRTALIQRRKDQFFFGAPLALSFSLGREKGGRRDEQILFASFTRTSQFDPWLNILRAAEAQLVGLYSIPFVTKGLLDKQTEHEHLVLLTLTRGGLRQSHFARGELQFSRLTTLNTPDSIEEAAKHINDESAKVYHYLTNNRLITRGTALQVMVLAHPAQFEIFQTYCNNNETLQFEMLDILAVSTRLKLKTPPHDSHADLLLSHLLATAVPKVQFADKRDRHQYRLWQWNRWLKGAAALVLIGALLFATHRAATIWLLTDQAETLHTQAQTDQSNYDALVQSLPAVSITPDNLRALINRWDDLQRRSPPPDATLNALSLALTEMPQVELKKIVWHLAGSAEEALSNASKATAPTQGSSAAGGFVVIEIEAVLPVALNQDQRGQLALIERFSDLLRKTQNSEVRIDKQPFELESGKSLKSGAENPANISAPRFSLRFITRI